ncbi:unnamed protein product [Arabidopsis thaliana]|uniref:Uncharacterized protein n=1 Tax=Arabidopsis thaliana TaxID=3702 RepID=A0A654FR33_ARATH|nr:unnamed protein product [Arabidopsis thaliana]
MPISATMVGALLGLGTQMYSNALRKLPYMRHPWEHVVGMGLGAVFANQLVKWDVKLKEDLDVMLAKARAANERRYFGKLVTFLVYEMVAMSGTLIKVKTEQYNYSFEHDLNESGKINTFD